MTSVLHPFNITAGPLDNAALPEQLPFVLDVPLPQQSIYYESFIYPCKLQQGWDGHCCFPSTTLSSIVLHWSPSCRTAASCSSTCIQRISRTLLRPCLPSIGYGFSNALNGQYWLSIRRKATASQDLFLIHHSGGSPRSNVSSSHLAYRFLPSQEPASYHRNQAQLLLRKCCHSLMPPLCEARHPSTIVYMTRRMYWKMIWRSVLRAGTSTSWYGIYQGLRNNTLILVASAMHRVLEVF